MHPGSTFMARTPLHSCVPSRVGRGTLGAWEHVVGGVASRKHADRSLAIHTPLSPTKRKRECCSKNTAVSQAVWVADCLLHPHLRLALLQGPRGLPEKREFSGSNVSTCSPPTAASGPAQPVSTMARVNFLQPGSEIQKQSLRSTERHSLNNQKNRAPNP